MAEDLLVFKDLKKRSKKGTLVRFDFQKYALNEFVVYKYTFDKNITRHLLKEMKKNNSSFIEIWNINEQWTKYSMDELTKIIEDLQ